jgi:hypothetical protein
MPVRKHPDGFPPCISLTVYFNEHAVYYQTAEEWWAEQVEIGCPPDWVSDDEKRLALASNSVWVCHWYPNTPVGSCSVSASSFEALMAFVNSAVK